MAHSTVHAILRRHGRSRDTARCHVSAFRRYEWPCPGDLLHMDIKRYPRFRRPGHAVTGDRRRVNGQRYNPLGHDYFHAIVDDHSRLVYGELLADEKAATVTAFTERALAWFAAHGISVRRLMTDGAFSYRRNRSLRELLASARASATSSPRPTRPVGTARLNASTRPWNANGLRACATATAPPETERCHTGSSTTTSADPTAHSAANHRSAALTTSQGTTTSRLGRPGGSAPGRRGSRG